MAATVERARECLLTRILLVYTVPTNPRCSLRQPNSNAVQSRDTVRTVRGYSHYCIFHPLQSRNIASKMAIRSRPSMLRTAGPRGIGAIQSGSMKGLTILHALRPPFPAECLSLLRLSRALQLEPRSLVCTIQKSRCGSRIGA